MRAAPHLAAGIAGLPSVAKSFAATQAAWRFFSNQRVKLSALVEPLREVGRDRSEQLDSKFVLLIQDWSKLSFNWKKDDLAQLTHAADVGYELTTALLVSPVDGAPLAPMEMHLRTGRGTLSTRDEAPIPQQHLEQVLPTMQASGSWDLSKPIVHVIDREADSVRHYRQWDDAGHKFLIRADDRRVQWNGQSILLSEISEKLRENAAFQHCGPAQFRGRDAQLWVAQTEVVLDRPAIKNVQRRKLEVPGPPLSLRLVVVQLRNPDDELAAQWLLLSNVPADWADAQLLARCYYWRWRIESFFKLLKSHGHQVEQWQQESGPAIARRLLVASMACVMIWQLQADRSAESAQLQAVLVKLSGRQIKRGRAPSASALLAGLWNLLAMLALLEQYQLSDLKKLAQTLPIFNTG